jgi:hypothetical protein
MKRLPLILLVVLFFSGLLNAQPVEVKIIKTPNGYELLRDNQPYYIKGAGGNDHLNELKYLGGNSIRTWSADDALEILDKAQKNGLTVMMGLWVQHERHGFNYDDDVAVRKQLDKFTSIVNKLKDHPALLLWGIGNEVDLFYSNTKVWDAIQDIAQMIHQVDPNHPTSTVTAGLDSMEVQLIKRHAPDIDIYGINTYGDIGSVPKNIKRFGWTGPYLIAEWGPNGHWEVNKTNWGAPIEQNSTQKAASYRNRYTEYIDKDSNYCIGSYVFLWGQKQETTATWYGLFTADGNPTEPLDQLYVAWRKSTPPNSAPSIQYFTIDGKTADQNIYLKADERYSASIEYSDPDKDKVKVEWLIFPESMAQSSGGDFENALQPELGLFKKRTNNISEFTAPKKEGAYRLFIFISDKGKRTAYANIPFYVMPRNENDPLPKNMNFKKQSIKDNDSSIN